MLLVSDHSGSRPSGHLLAKQLERHLYSSTAALDICEGGVGDTSRNHALDGMRGLAATAVILYHSILVERYFLQSVLPIAVQDLPTYGDWAAKVALSCFHGQTAVIIFFVLSGLVLRLSLDRVGDVGSVALYNFVIRRLLRLYPAILFALAFCSAISWVWKTANFPGAGLHRFEIATNFRLLFENAVLWGRAFREPLGLFKQNWRQSPSSFWFLLSPAQRALLAHYSV